ncbi:phosphonoacetaldehyde reductase [Thalassomonas viridans]|uniref:Phosphonoacetaldehyde reductase n=1 Tax=Thalassomonas viridans TaxID=137584 RepID=A0AAF0C9D3_9GAMM|nr:phosphonoacetaldehyde reductase [Thalassomonas viridans]WDE05653.1 phosphonoacetaldehyde reductase [Thalassomonas viridans]
MWNFINPVNLRFSPDCLKNLGELIAGRSYCIVTYDGEPFANWVQAIRQSAGSPVKVVSNVEPNPSLNHLIQQARELKKCSPFPEVIVGLGGGSALDSAKFLAACESGIDNLVAMLRQGYDIPDIKTKIIAIPTTAGTGSEVTCWATIWDTENQSKLSLESKALYAEHALIDSELMLELPLGITINTALDALSHAFESLWNKNRNPVSNALAVQAIKGIFEYLPLLVKDLKNPKLRQKIAVSSTLAGLAFSNTKTALAHNISYEVTMKYGVVHGLACSFTLPGILTAMIGQDTKLDYALAQVFPVKLELAPQYMKDFFSILGVATEYADYGIKQTEWTAIVSNAFDGARGANFIGLKEVVLPQI